MAHHVLYRVNIPSQIDTLEIKYTLSRYLTEDNIQHLRRTLFSLLFIQQHTFVFDTESTN